MLIQKLFYRLFPVLRKLVNHTEDLNVYFSSCENIKGENAEHHLFKINKPYHINHIKIGKYTYIDQNSWISDTIIGRFCSIGPNFFCGWGIHPTDGISTSPMFYSPNKQNGYTLSSNRKCAERKPIQIGNDVFIGANVTVLDGVTIGDGAIIGAGAVVSKDIPPYAIAVGCPIQIKRFRFSQTQIDALLRIQWWNFEEEQLKAIEQMFFDIDSFINKFDVTKG